MMAKLADSFRNDGQAFLKIGDKEQYLYHLDVAEVAYEEQGDEMGIASLNWELATHYKREYQKCSPEKRESNLNAMIRHYRMAEQGYKKAWSDKIAVKEPAKKLCYS